MERLTSKSLFGILVLGLMLLVGLSSDAMAQGRGRGRGNSNWDKKCAKFVNCHDARDGRWDGRGPNRDRDSRFGNIFRRNRRDRDRDWDRFERRRRVRDRDWDNRRWRRSR
ncbi:MAG TPA: hypothetical protein VFT48_01550 [Pyrinomonadaceae bacterium]|nr:hypothetical protein [Pyrinomonadaceae bacterium]